MIRHYQFGFLLVGTCIFASCGTQTQPAAAPDAVTTQINQFAQYPELQDAGTQSLLKEHASDPEMLDALQRAYGLKEDGAGDLTVQSREPTGGGESRPEYVQEIAWSSAAYYQGEKRHPLYSGLDWSSDGCSAPNHLGLGARNTFRPACDVHDFGYRNLPKMEARSNWETSRKFTDHALHRNMDAICKRMSFFPRGACYVASTAYYEAVRNFGTSNWR